MATHHRTILTLIARFMGPTWGPHGADRTQVGPMLAKWTYDKMIFREYYSMFLMISTVYPKKYAHGFCFAVLCCGYTLTDFPISIRLTSLALWQSNNCPSASKATLMNMDKYFMLIHYERLHNHNKAKHNKTVCIFLGIYCTYNDSTIMKATASIITNTHLCESCAIHIIAQTAYRKYHNLEVVEGFHSCGFHYCSEPAMA